MLSYFGNFDLYKMSTSIPSSDAQTAQTVISSIHAVTVSSSDEMAAPGMNVTVDPSVNDSAATIEHVPSSSRHSSRPEPIAEVISVRDSSSSSDDLEVLEAQAAAAEARLKLAKAKRKLSSKASSASRRSRDTRDDGRGMAAFMEEDAGEPHEELRPVPHHADPLPVPDDAPLPELPLRAAPAGPLSMLANLFVGPTPSNPQTSNRPN